MNEYYLVCTQCDKRTQITEDEARAYGIMLLRTNGSAASCKECGGAVKGDIVSVGSSKIEHNDQ